MGVLAGTKGEVPYFADSTGPTSTSRGENFPGTQRPPAKLARSPS